MTRLIRFIFSLILSYILTATAMFGQGTPVSATGHISAEIIPVFSAGETSQMNFGKFSPGPQGGEIHLTPASTLSVVGSIYTGMGMHNAASFYISGDTDASYTITLPNIPVILMHASSAKTMIIENWMSNPGLGTGAGILQDGYQIVYVGATLKVGPLSDNPVGIYAGTYTITFDFN
jgi:hypothetical protein